MSSPANLGRTTTTQPLTLSLLKVYKKIKELIKFCCAYS